MWGGRDGPQGRSTDSGFTQPRPQTLRRNLYSLPPSKHILGEEEESRFQTPGLTFIFLTSLALTQASSVSHRL